jgi:hypothetical protein
VTLTQVTKTKGKNVYPTSSGARHVHDTFDLGAVNLFLVGCGLKPKLLSHVLRLYVYTCVCSILAVVLAKARSWHLTVLLPCETVRLPFPRIAFTCIKSNYLAFDS